MLEFMTTIDIMEKFVDMIEKERIRKSFTQKDLYTSAGMSATAYRSFMDTKNTKFENIINILLALDLTSKIQELINVEQFTSLDEIRNEKNKKIRRRVRRSISD